MPIYFGLISIMMWNQCYLTIVFFASSDKNLKRITYYHYYEPTDDDIPSIKHVQSDLYLKHVSAIGKKSIWMVLF